VPRRALTIGVVLALAISGLTVIAQLGSSPASATTTTSLVTASTRQGVADAVNSAYFSAGSTTAVVAENSAGAVHLASSYAAVRQLPVVVATSGTTTSDVTSRLSTLHATHVVLVSVTPSWFTTAFQSSLTSAGVVTDSYIQSSDLFTRWTTAAGTSAAEYAIARSDNATAVNLATAYATSRRIPLVIFESTTATATLTSFFTSVNGKKLTFFDPAIVPGAQMMAAENEQMTTVDVSDPLKAFVWVADGAQLSGASSNRLLVGAADALDELGLAGVAASKISGLAAPAGARASLGAASRANEYLTLWKNNTESVALVGASYTSADLTTVASPTSGAPSVSPTFRVTGLTRTSTTFTLAMTSVTGATSYVGYDPSGAMIATSTTPSLVFSAPTSSVLVVASGSSGELARIDVHTNQYDSVSDLSTLVTVDANGGTNHLKIFGTIHTPRLIARIKNDPYGLPPDNFGTMTPIAITCANDYTDVTADGTKEYMYEVTDLTNVDVRACGSTYAQAPGSATAGVFNEKVTAPPTDQPCFCMTAKGTMTNMVAPITARKSGSSMAQQLLTRTLTSTPAAGKEARRGPGDGWEPIITEWMAYIPESKFLVPGTTFDPAKPFLYFAGDGHGTWNPNESARFKQKVTWTWGSTHSVSYTEEMGTSHEYKCTWGGGSCTEIATGTAPLSQLNATSLVSNATSGFAEITASAANPLIGVAPPIDTRVDIVLGTVVSFVYGYHDNMPKHEFYIGTPDGDAYKIYESSYISAAQLPCLASSPTTPIPGCGILFNALI